MSARLWTAIRLGVQLGILALVVLVSSAAVAGPPPARPDPKEMSGLGRVDPGLAAGKLSVRCLLGDFDQPAVNTEVTLELTSADGALTEKKTETTDEQGRATFEGLEPFTEGVAVASATLDGEEQRSRALAISAEGGTRTMLVKGAKVAAAQGGSQHGGQGAMPLPGKPFPLPDRDPGTLVVGALDLEKAEPIPGVTVTLHVRPAGGDDEAADLQTLEEVTDEKGRVVFDNLVAPAVPDGAMIRVEAVLYDGQAPKASQEFAMGDTAQAVVLTHGRAPQAAAPPAAQGGPQPGRRPVPGPRKDPKLPTGTVKVQLWGPSDEPIADTAVTVVKKDMGGADRFFRGTTDERGTALVEGVEGRADSFYLVRVEYGGAPYESNFFEMPERVGAAVDLRVFPTTADRTKVKSAVQYDVISLERDKAQVVQVYEVLIEGDEAFWPPGGEMRIEAAEGGVNVVVLPQATEFLEEIESAPYALLARPLPPGEVAQLSIAYIIDHKGTAEIDWTAPFPLISAGVLVNQGLKLETDTVLERKPSPHGEGQRGEPQELVSFAPRANAEIEFSIAGLPTRPKWPRYTAWGVLALVILIVGVSMATRRRTDLRSSLLERRAALETRLRAPDLPTQERIEIAHALDRVIRKLEAMSPAPPATPTET